MTIAPVDLGVVAGADENVVRFVGEEESEPALLSFVRFGVTSPERRFEGFKPFTVGA